LSRLPTSTLNRENSTSTQSISLRDVEGEDEAFLLLLFCSTRAEELGLSALPPEQLDALMRLQFNAQRTSYRAQFPAGRDQIILISGEPAGRLYVHRSESEVRLVDISLLPEFRNSGIGRELVEGLQREAAADAKRLTLHVAITNPAARLYKRLGFAITHDTGSYYRMEWPGRRSINRNKEVQMIDTLSKERFVGMVGSRFSASRDDINSFEIDLVDIVDHGSTVSQAQFSLMFVGRADAPALQGVYTLQNEELGSFELFLVPVARDAQGLHYEAVVNRFLEERHEH
jgi:GNAT superfamily N-acetyltransferase